MWKLTAHRLYFLTPVAVYYLPLVLVLLDRCGRSSFGHQRYVFDCIISYNIIHSYILEDHTFDIWYLLNIFWYFVYQKIYISHSQSYMAMQQCCSSESAWTYTEVLLCLVSILNWWGPTLTHLNNVVAFSRTTVCGTPLPFCSVLSIALLTPLLVTSLVWPHLLHAAPLL